MLCDGVKPPAVDGRIDGCCRYGERLFMECTLTWLDSVEALDRLDSLCSEACEREECDRGGGRRGKLLLAFMASSPQECCGGGGHCTRNVEC